MWKQLLLRLTFCFLPASTTQTMNQWRRHWIRSFLNLTVGVYLTMSEICIDFGTVHKDDISREQLKELLYEEITSFKPAIGLQCT
jgi:hypothetical protein